MNYIIKKYQISSILIAISGGQDSIYLIKLIEILKNNFYFHKVEYIYIDHQWKIDSLKQIEHIINYLIFLKKKLSIYQINKRTLSENNSRIYRYHIILNHAIKNKYQAIITAHTKTDKLETFLLNLIRGTSIEGINSLTLHKQINQQIHLLRPLINENRDNITWYCRQNCLPIWSDTTNYNYKIKRNRIRFELLPYLRKYFNINIENNCNKFLTTCFYDNEYIKQNIIKLYTHIRHNKYIAINILDINKYHISIQTRILQLFFFHNFHILINKNILIKLIKIFNKQYSKKKIKWKYLEFHITYIWLCIRFNK